MRRFTTLAGLALLTACEHCTNEHDGTDAGNQTYHEHARHSYDAAFARSGRLDGGFPPPLDAAVASVPPISPTSAGDIRVKLAAPIVATRGTVTVAAYLLDKHAPWPVASSCYANGEPCIRVDEQVAPGFRPVVFYDMLPKTSVFHLVDVIAVQVDDRLLGTPGAYTNLFDSLHAYLRGVYETAQTDELRPRTLILVGGGNGVFLVANSDSLSALEASVTALSQLAAYFRNEGGHAPAADFPSTWDSRANNELLANQADVWRRRLEAEVPGLVQVSTAELFLSGPPINSGAGDDDALPYQGLGSAETIALPVACVNYPTNGIVRGVLFSPDVHGLPPLRDVYAYGTLHQCVSGYANWQELDTNLGIHARLRRDLYASLLALSYCTAENVERVSRVVQTMVTPVWDDTEGSPIIVRRGVRLEGS